MKRDVMVTSSFCRLKQDIKILARKFLDYFFHLRDFQTVTVLELNKFLAEQILVGA